MAADTIARHREALLQLLQITKPARHDDLVLAVLDAAMAQLALEAVALRALADHPDVDPRSHLDAHGRARLALFRMATSPSDTGTVALAFEELRAAFTDRPYCLAGALREHLDPQELKQLGEEMNALR